jgi:hypothetical protein
VLAAPSNVGKLSLFNVLARREAAIVSAIPGTIRDVTEVTSLGTRKPRYCGGRGFHGLRVRLGRWWSPAPGSTIGRSEDQANHNLGSGSGQMPTAPGRSRSWPENAKLSKHRESLPMLAHPAQDRDLPHNLANEVQGLQINEGSVSRRRPVTRCRLAGARPCSPRSPSDFHASAAPADDTRQNVASTTTHSGQIPTL